MLPEVRAAIDAAAQHHVHLDELMAAIGARLAELTKAEWGMVSSGCSAALTHATAACVAGGNPDLHVRIPNLSGFPKDEVIIPRHSRNVYDAADPRRRRARRRGRHRLRSSKRRSVRGRRWSTSSPVRKRTRARSARERSRRWRNQKHVPVLVDAAAEILTVPNVHLENGATLVAYSGGKCIRGPQSAGLLLGRKDLVQAAWVHSAPHHGFARSMKVGKEEAIGMLMAVEMWTKRDHKAEWSRWLSWLDAIAKQVSRIEGVTTSMTETTDAVQPHAVADDSMGSEAARHQRRGRSRGICSTPSRESPRPADETATARASISITPYMMAAGEEKIVAERIHAALSNPPRQDAPAPNGGARRRT